jgi:hypothetical protein
VIRTLMDGHRPGVWCSDRYSAQQGHADAHQTCLAHLARDVAYADEASEDILPSRLKLWLHRVFALADGVGTLATSTIARKRRTLERSLDAILAAPTSCDLARALQSKFRRARDQLLTFARKWGISLSITHKPHAEGGAQSDIGEAREAAPHDHVAGRRILGAGEITAEPGDLGQIVCQR